MQAPLLVLDVNVIVSGTTLSNTPPSQIIQAWQTDQVKLAISPLILEELRSVLSYEKVRKMTGLSKVEADLFVHFLWQGATVVPGTTRVNVSPDPADNKLFACAIEAKADFIVSGDKAHVLSVKTYQGVQTISPRDFVDTQLTHKAA